MELSTSVWKLHFSKVNIIQKKNLPLYIRTMMNELEKERGLEGGTVSTVLWKSCMRHPDLLCLASSCKSWLCHRSLCALLGFITSGLPPKEKRGGKSTRVPDTIHSASEIKTSYRSVELPSAQRQPFSAIPQNMFHAIFSISSLSPIRKRPIPIHLLILFNVDFHVL